MHRSRYVWSSASPPLEVHVALEVVQRLSLEALEAFKAIPRRGLEIGGLLLDRSETRGGVPILLLDDYVPVQSEHRGGPSYRLSPSDVERLEQLLRTHPEGIGLYRTQTRSEDISLQEEDLETLKRYFTSGWHLFLMIQPASRAAAMFVTQEGAVAAEHQFPFRPADLVTETVQEEFPPGEAAGSATSACAALEEPTPAEVPTAPEPRQARMPVPWMRWLIPAAALLAGLAGGATASFIYLLESRRPSPATARPAVITPFPRHIALQVQRAGAALHLTWDGNSPAARAATRGTLYITDGNLHSSMELGPSELSAGLLSYWPTTGDVSFELRTFGPGGPATDIASAISPMAPAPPPKVELAAARPAAVPGVTPPRKRRKRSAPVESDRVTVDETSPSPAAAAAGKTAPLESPVPEPILTPETAPARPEPAPVAHAPAKPSPEISVSAEPVHTSKLGRMVSHVPLLRRLKKSRQSYVPPQPVHQVKPTLTAREKHAITKPVPIDVKVYISEAGRVQYAELVSGHDRDLDAAAVYAARRWSFTPARMGGENVPGEMILHFTFGVNQ